MSIARRVELELRTTANGQVTLAELADYVRRLQETGCPANHYIYVRPTTDGTGETHALTAVRTYAGDDA